MEFEGLKRQMKFLAELGISVHTLITDRHLCVNKWMRVNCKAVLHAYDLWHVAKGFKKKLLTQLKQRDNKLLCVLSKAMTNHLYHCVLYSHSSQVLEAKWLFMEHHIMDEVL